MNYTEYQSYLQQLLVVEDTEGQTLLANILPAIIQFAELWMYRDPDFDFLVTRTSDLTATTVSGTPSVAIPTQFIVVEAVNLIVPAGASPTTAGAQRVATMRINDHALKIMFPDQTATAPPAPYGTYYSIFNEEDASPASAINLGPTPDGAYKVEFRGTFRPAALTSGNPNTFLTDYMPDLFLAASMIFAAGWQRDYGQSGDDPKLAMSWVEQYNMLKTGAAVEEARKKWAGPMGGPYPIPTILNAGSAPAAASPQ